MKLLIILYNLTFFKLFEIKNLKVLVFQTKDYVF